MKKTITFNQLKALVKEGLEPRGRKWGDIKKEILGERNDEKPVRLRDVPPRIKAYLEGKLGATIYDNNYGMDELPYLYVTIPLTPKVSRGGTRLTTKILNELIDTLEADGWHIIKDGQLEPDDACPDYTVLISPYKNPHEPGSDFIDRIINADRQAAARREKEYSASFDDEVEID